MFHVALVDCRNDLVEGPSTIGFRGSCCRRRSRRCCCGCCYCYCCLDVGTSRTAYRPLVTRYSQQHISNESDASLPTLAALEHRPWNKPTSLPFVHTLELTSNISESYTLRLFPWLDRSTSIDACPEPCCHFGRRSASTPNRQANCLDFALRFALSPPCV